MSPSDVRRISRRRFIQYSAYLTGAGMLAACSPQPTAAPAPAAPAAATAAPAAATAAPAAAAAAADLSNKNLEQLVKLVDTKAQLKGFASPLYVAVDVKSFNDQTFSQKMEELTNVRVNWEHAADGNESTFDLKMASGDLPDLIGGYISCAWYARYGQKGALEPLNDHIGKNPYFAGVMKQMPRLKALITAPDGKIYSFPRVLEQGQQTFGGFYMRKDWLDEIGMDVPKTTDEYYTALKEMKKKDPKRYPLSGYFGPGTTMAFNYLIWQWGVGRRGPNQPVDFYVDGKTVKFGPIQPQYLEALTFINKLYKEELADPEASTINEPTVLYKRWTDGICGVGYGWADDMVAIMKIDPKIDIVGTRPPKGPYGHEESLSNYFEIDTSNGMAVPVSSKNKELAAKFYDLYYSRSGAILMNFGVYGDTYTEQDGKFAYTDKVMHDPKLGPLEYLWNWTSPTWIGGMYMMTDQPRGLYTGRAGEAQITWNQAPWQTIQYPPLLFSDEENTVIQQTMPDINTLLDETIAGLVSGTKSFDTDYKSMVDTIKSKNIDKVTQVYQAAYDRYLSNLPA